MNAATARRLLGFAVPGVLWAASAIGLVVMLVGAGPWDGAGLIALCVPVLAIGRAWWRERAP